MKKLVLLFVAAAGTWDGLQAMAKAKRGRKRSETLLAAKRQLREVGQELSEGAKEQAKILGGQIKEFAKEEFGKLRDQGVEAGKIAAKKALDSALKSMFGGKKPKNKQEVVEQIAVIEGAVEALSDEVEEVEQEEDTTSFSDDEWWD